MDLQIYIDETRLFLDGQECLLYGAVATEDPRPAMSRLLDIREKLAVPPEVEIKWNMAGDDPKSKAEIKEATITAMQGLTFLVSISQTRDKNIAFHNMLKQVRKYCLHKSANSVQICFDRDCFTDFRQMKNELITWCDVRCTLFARGESDLSLMLQYADMFTGAFAYMVHAQTKDQVPETPFRVGSEGNWMMPIDEYFYICLRRGLPGVRCEYDEKFGDGDPNFWLVDSRDLGLCLNGSFSEKQLDLLKEFIFVFKGPMH